MPWTQNNIDNEAQFNFFKYDAIGDPIVKLLIWPSNNDV